MERSQLSKYMKSIEILFNTYRVGIGNKVAIMVLWSQIPFTQHTDSKHTTVILHNGVCLNKQ